MKTLLAFCAASGMVIAGVLAATSQASEAGLAVASLACEVAASTPAITMPLAAQNASRVFIVVSP